MDQALKSHSKFKTGEFLEAQGQGFCEGKNISGVEMSSVGEIHNLQSMVCNVITYTKYFRCPTEKKNLECLPHHLLSVPLSIEHAVHGIYTVYIIARV